MKTTQKQFNLFKSECLRWADRFELNGWRLDFFLKDIGNAQALVMRDYEGCVITVKLDIKITKDDFDDYDQIIKETAKHEMIHILVGNLSELAQSRYVQRDEIDKAEEELVRKLGVII